MFGAIIPVGFEGGHGTAGGLAETFKELGWEQGKDFALASATMGMMSAIIFGMVLINVAIRRGPGCQVAKTVLIPGRRHYRHHPRSAADPQPVSSQYRPTQSNHLPCIWSLWA